MPSPTPEEWSHVEAEGVRLSVRTPTGWQSIVNGHGILLARHANLYNAPASNEMLVYVFVPPVENIGLSASDDDNLAWQVLDHVTRIPALVGKSSVHPAVPVMIGGHEGAYYLLSDGDGNRVLVMAVMMSAQDEVIVCNISTSDEHVEQIRHVLPMVFSNLTVNGERLEPQPLPLDWLPEPLVFPTYVSHDENGS